MSINGTPGNGSNRLEEAIASLVQGQASLVQIQASLAQTQATMQQNQATFQQNLLMLNQRMDETEKSTAARFERIERLMDTIVRTLAEHGRILDKLPEAIREKIGFKPTA